jgi:hypothetical protein
LCLVNSAEIKIPKGFDDVKESPQAHLWNIAMDEEMNAIASQGVFRLSTTKKEKLQLEFAGFMI